MASQTLTFTLSEESYERLRQRADQVNRSVEEELAVMVATAVPLTDGLPLDLVEALIPLPLLDNQELWVSAQGQFPPEAAEELEELNFKRQREGLSAPEAQRSAELLRQYERSMLVRAQAMLLLKARGVDISSLLQAP